MNVFRLASLFFIFAFGLSGLRAQVVVGGAGPAEQFMRGYMMNNEAERQHQAGNLAGAKDLYSNALAIVDGVAKTDPTWQPTVVAYRRSKISDALTTVQAKLAAPQPAPVVPSLPAPATGGLSTPVPMGTTPLVVPAPSPVAPALAAPASLDDYLNGIKAAVQEQLKSAQQEKTELYSKVGQYQLGYETALKQRDEIATNYQSLSATAVAQQTKIKDLESAVASGAATKAELDASKRTLADTNEALAEAKDRLAKVERGVMDQSKQLMESAMKLATAERERDALAKEKTTVTAERDALAKDKTAALAASEKTATERDRMSKERDAISLKLLGLQAQYDALKKAPAPAGSPAASKEMKVLMAENERLKKDLESAREQVENLKGDVARKDKEIGLLKSDLAKIQTDLNALKKENAAYSSQVSDLTLQLKDLKAKAEVAQSKAPKAEASQLQQENDLLKGIVKRQLIQQTRQQETKALVIKQLEKMGDQAKGLVDQVEQLGGVRVALSPAEQKLFTAPELKEFMSTGGIQSTFVSKSQAPGAAASSNAGSATPASGAAAVDALLNQANTALAAGKLADAATAYQDALRADAKNASALAGLAWTRLQQGSLEEAETTLRKSLALDANNSTTHYMLGVAFYRRDKSNEAMKSFEKSLELNANNARARHYLGIIASKLGLLDRAEREFKASLAIDPTYAEGYFNLAVLYVTWDPPKWDVAKKSYDEAVKKGLKPDLNLEKILNGAPVSAR